MKVIHKIQGIKKLSTLKHSWNLLNFALKRSWICAETLLHSIYTYIYLYINTCSWQLLIVNNCFFQCIKAIAISSQIKQVHLIKPLVEKENNHVGLI